MSILAKKPAPIAAPSAADTFGTTDKARDGIPVDRRTLRATGRTEQFATRISPEIKKLFARLAKKAGVTHNALFADMTKLWEQQEGVPDSERNADRSRPLLVYASFGVATAVLLEAGLSYLGLGVQPPTPSWGNMLNTARSISTMERTSWQWIPPAITTVMFVLAVNFVGDGIRDALDPRTLFEK